MMFDYDLAGKQVILVLDHKMLKALEPLGIPGSPLYGQVHKVDDNGLWMENHSFPVCPIDQPRVVGPEGNALCHAHVFIPSSAIVSLAAFPNTVAELEDHPELHKIGFTPKQPD